MPKNSMSKSKSGKQMSATKANQKAIDRVMKEGDLVIGRVEANLGEGGFRVTLNTGMSAVGVPRGLFTKRSMPIYKDSIVLLENAKAGKNHEIVGVLDKKSTKALYDAGQITSYMLKGAEDEDKEDGFEFDDSDEEDNIDVENL